jgi:hypothetical protein
MQVRREHLSKQCKRTYHLGGCVDQHHGDCTFCLYICRSHPRRPVTDSSPCLKSYVTSTVWSRRSPQWPLFELMTGNKSMEGRKGTRSTFQYRSLRQPTTRLAGWWRAIAVNLITEKESVQWAECRHNQRLQRKQLPISRFRSTNRIQISETHAWIRSERCIEEVLFLRSFKSYIWLTDSVTT